MKNIEVEVRGRLDEIQYNALLTILKKKGRFIETKDRVLLDYSTFLPKEGIRERTKDIRLRITNGQPEMITKIGKWGGRESRKELSVKTEKGSFDTLVQTYAVLGLTKAVLCIRHTEVYEFQGIEFSAVTVPNHSYYFEAECLVENHSEIAKMQKKIEEVCNDLGVALFDDAGFHDYIEELNREANEVFDYEDYQDGYFTKRFGF